MRIKSLRTGNVVDVERKVGEALVALGDAVDVTPPPAPKPEVPNITRLSPWAARETATKPQHGDLSMKTVTTSLSFDREQKLAERTQQLRPRVRSGVTGETISVGSFCQLLGVSASQLEGMSEERLKHICTAVPKVPDAVSGKEWGQPPYRYEEFMARGERWIDFLYRIGVGAATLLMWERCELARRCRPNAEQALGISAGLEAAATRFAHVD